jgi:hypothetical protein
MSEKALHNFVIFVLLVAVVLLGMVASKSERFSGGAVPPSVPGNLSARLRSVTGTGALAGRLRGENATISSLPARLRGGAPITGGDAGAGGLMARIDLPSLEHFRGVGAGGSMSMAARLRTESSNVLGSASSGSDKSGHDTTATKMSIVPVASKMTIMSNLTTK